MSVDPMSCNTLKSGCLVLSHMNTTGSTAYGENTAVVRRSEAPPMPSSNAFCAIVIVGSCFSRLTIGC